MILPKEAQEAVERAEKATSGPWERYTDTPQAPIVRSIASKGFVAEIRSEHPYPDADFIAHAREDTPMLAALLAEALVEVERHRGRCKNTALAWAHAGEMQDAVVRLEAELAEDRAKLKALVRLYIKHDARSHYKDDQQCAACRRDAILGGSSE